MHSKGAFAIQILHQGVSSSNIVIFKGKGYLIDWEMAKFFGSTESATPRQMLRTGTSQFMSAHLVKDRIAEHCLTDNMESIFWVLLWNVIMYSPSSLSTEQHSKFMKNVLMQQMGHWRKQLEALQMLLSELTLLFCSHYDKSEATDEQIFELLKYGEPQVQKSHQVYQCVMARHYLRDHTYIIQLFDKYLKMDWPFNDAGHERLVSIDGGEIQQVAT
ncbi:hypothetical protein JVT61DRAFT_7428 [Boletus reticuloceps]|uniref:Protein kinase domain-containing protein n=1 Tax=Boletus reticuloceps TaxID=495285 RepID=A0A8I3A5P9_9AGAM|nr:hypothetical protein JVT61DRAFT_7428 [Boletus reticuloceps]